MLSYSREQFLKEIGKGKTRTRWGSTTIGPEDAIQMAYFKWVDSFKGKYPDLDLIFAVPNGGKRSKMEGALFKATGVRAGVPDVCIPVPRQACPGMWIEFKSSTGTVPASQKEWHVKLRLQGHQVFVCRSWIVAANLTMDYLSLHGEERIRE